MLRIAAKSFGLGVVFASGLVVGVLESADLGATKRLVAAGANDALAKILASTLENLPTIGRGMRSSISSMGTCSVTPGRAPSLTACRMSSLEAPAAIARSSASPEEAATPSAPPTTGPAPGPRTPVARRGAVDPSALNIARVHESS